MNNEIFDAIKTADIRKVEKILNDCYVKSERDFLDTMLNTRNDQLRTPLHYAIRQCRIECGRAILQSLPIREDAKVSRKLKTLKHELRTIERDYEDDDANRVKALKRKRKRIRRESLKRKEDFFIALLKAKDKRGRTPLHFAASNMGFPIKILLDGSNGANLQSKLVLNVLTQDDIVQLQTMRREILDIRDSNGRTALHFASFNGMASNVRILIRAGSNPYLTDQHDHTPLAVAKDAITRRG